MELRIGVVHTPKELNLELDGTADELVGNVDLAPTFAAMSGVATPSFVDGRSLIDDDRLQNIRHGQARLIADGLRNDRDFAPRQQF